MNRTQMIRDQIDGILGGWVKSLKVSYWVSLVGIVLENLSNNVYVTGYGVGTKRLSLTPPSSFFPQM